MNWKNFFLKKTIQLIRPLIFRHPKKERILVISTTALGDTLWATPALENLRASFPDAYIAVLTSPVGLEVLKNNPSVDRLFLLEEPLLPRFFSLWKKLYRERFDTILLFHASQRLALPLASLLGASQIVGTSGLQKGLDELLTDPLPSLKQHEIIRRLKIIEAIGAKVKSETLSFHLAPEEIPTPKPGLWIALHPGSKDPFKRWPAESFAALGKRLKELLPCEILITGNASERDLMQKIAAQIPNAHIAAPNLSLRAFGALLTQMDLLISNDTGPLHLACALNRPVLGIYSSTDPALCGPHKAPLAAALFKKPTCTPCLKRSCRLPFCFLQIGVEEAAKMSYELLTGGVQR